MLLRRSLPRTRPEGIIMGEGNPSRAPRFPGSRHAYMNGRMGGWWLEWDQMSSSCSSSWSLVKVPVRIPCIEGGLPRPGPARPCRRRTAHPRDRGRVRTTSRQPRAYLSRSAASALVCERSVTIGTLATRAGFAFGSGGLGGRTVGVRAGAGKVVSSP
jgi:hypothetical protein